jgi:GTP cyclohydrolase II
MLPVDLAGGRGIPEEALFRLLVFRNLADDMEHVALVKGNVKGASSVLTRVHSVCITGDVLGSMRCDCGPQLHEALATLAGEENGVLIYIRDHEGRGIGITQKVRAYALQQQHNLDTYEVGGDGWGW